MAFDKQFKDPVYGYINIDSDFVSNIIDTPAFQRLKDIRQTSYAPLFPGAYHNRYIHSLGVYHLGRIAFESICSQLEEKLKEIASDLNISEIQKIFQLSCLLHDVGHAPFSHTGEDFYIDKTNTLYNQLKDSVNCSDFSTDFNALGTKKPAPHECMSCVVGLKTFPNYFDTPFKRNLFARCIIGMPFRFNEKPPERMSGMTSEELKDNTKKYEEFRVRKVQTELLNCVISLLNSSIIDVDRLDYIIRDATTIGFQNAQVDYIRLLGGMRIVEYNHSLCIGYHKSAISVIESAVYAHDSERKWIQGHPSILYEMEVLKNAMGMLTNTFATVSDPNPLFCYESLTEEGKFLSISVPILSNEAQDLVRANKLWTSDAQRLMEKENLFTNNCRGSKENVYFIQKFPISLLADEDVLYLMKQFCKSGLGYEYFARGIRRIPLWKSEAEFRALFQERIRDSSQAIKTLEEDFEGLVNYCQEKIGQPIVSKRIFAILDSETQEAELAKKKKEIHPDQYNDIMSSITTNRHWANVLCDLAKELHIDPEFLIVFQKKFSSSFKPALGKIPMLFPNVKNSIVPLENVVDVLKSSSDRKSNFFHLFYKPIGPMDEARKRKIINTIVEKLISEAN